MRAALGAGRGRLVRQMLTESLLIAAIGAALGMVIAAAGVRTLVALLPADFPRADTIHVNAAVFAFTALIALATGLLFGLARLYKPRAKICTIACAMADAVPAAADGSFGYAVRCWWGK